MTQIFHILIVDDEMQSRALIRRLLDNLKGRSFDIKEAGGIKDAIKMIDIQQPDLIFLDVEMRGETGFDLLNKLSGSKAEIIFITAHSEFAVKAFRYSAIDYLLKPVDKNEFNEALEKALHRIVSNISSASAQIGYLVQQLKNNFKIPDKLPVSTSEGTTFLPMQDILYCRAVSNYTEFRLFNNQKIVSSHTLGYYNELLNGQHFFRIHRSYLINLSHIRMYKRGDGGSVIMNDGEEIEISRNNKEAFLKLFKG